VGDNAYTNVMARWNLERGAEVASLVRRRWPERWAELVARLGIVEDEPGGWLAAAERIAVGVDPATGLVEQFAGYFDLEEIDLVAYEPRTAPMDVLLGRERTQQSQVIKQADVVMLLALLEERFPARARRANFAYYEPRCGHGSSLSPPIHALVAARLGDTERAARYLRQTAAIDLDDAMGNTAQGVHIAALGGLWQAVVLGLSGLTATPTGLRLSPRLPDDWRALRFPVCWRGRTLRIKVTGDPPLCTATLERGRPLRLAVGEASHRLIRGESWTCAYDPTVEREVER
jgi:trehalose/maltose hydrolase-like predicted phosphorylase